MPDKKPEKHHHHAPHGEAVDNTFDDFRELVNMTASELEKWLDTDESKEVGWKGDDGSAKESVGHKSGKKIVSLLHEKKADISAEDLDHMKKVVGYIKRHLAERPGGNTTETPWRYSLMNWGHDPEKDH